MIPPKRSEVLAAIVAAVRRRPSFWSEDAIAISIACADYIHPSQVEAFLDFAENLACAVRVVRPLPHPKKVRPFRGDR